MVKKEKIMVVDDEEHLLELVRIVLEKEGYEVVAADSGQQCLKLLETVKPDLILLDVMMPEMGGMDVVKKIRADPKTKDLKIVFLTILMKEEIKLDFLKKNKILDWIPKPFSNKEMVMRVKKNLS